MFGVHVDGWTFKIIVANSPNELTFTHFTGNDRWYVPFPGCMQGTVDLVAWETAAKGT